jgi:hypothetical protein
MSDRAPVEYDKGTALTQFEDVGSDVREAYERHKTSRDVIEYDNDRPLGDVIRASLDSVKTKAESRARRNTAPAPA